MSLLLPNDPLGMRVFSNFVSFTNFTRDSFLGAEMIFDPLWTIPAYANGSFVGLCNGSGMQITLPPAQNVIPSSSYTNGDVPASFWNGWHIWLKNVCPGTATINVQSPSTMNGGPQPFLPTGQAVGIFAVRGNYLTFGPV